MGDSTNLCLCSPPSGLVYEHVLGENKFTFVEECRNPQSVTILLKAPNKHSLTKMKVRFHEFSRRFASFFFFFAKKMFMDFAKMLFNGLTLTAKSKAFVKNNFISLG